MEKYLLFILLCMLRLAAVAQDSTALNKLTTQPDKIFKALNKKAISIEDKLDKKTLSYLNKLQKQENRLKDKMWLKDSGLTKQLFNGVNEEYARIKDAPQVINKYESVYSGHLDSLSTSLNFLKNVKGLNNTTLQKTLDQYKALQGKLDQADRIKSFISERQRMLKESLQNMGLAKELKQFQKQVFYYAAQIKEYKNLFENPSKIEEKLFEAIQQLPEFKDFFAQNSMLGSFFPLEGSGTVGSVRIQGLQTRAMVTQSLASRFGSGPNAIKALQQNMKSAQSELENAKNKLLLLSEGSYGNSNVEMPGGFKPNTQKTKSFLQRLECGVNLQTQKGGYYFPVTSDVGLSAGYKINDKSSTGIGISYKVGWGKSWNNIDVTNEGIGLRSFVEMKLKGTFYISGGYEQNYRASFKNFQQLQDYSAWQSSGLFGISKKYKLSKKLKGEMKLLWDFLSYR
ncbi:MAG: hypothetical protein ACTHMD_02355, partial [Flavisolibacter sp.]